MPAISGTVKSASPGTKGFGTNTPVSPSAAREFLARGYLFCLRYVGRLAPHPGDLTYAEAEGIVDAGLALMVVQHVQSESGWTPTGALGTTYGANAAAFAQDAGIPPGVNVWLDLEGVSPGTAVEDVIAYCQNWYQGVADAGYLPGIYVGWHPGLSAQQLYDLPFKHYWGAYDVDADSMPACGWCLKESPASGGTIAGIDTEAYDDNLTHIDSAGQTVQWLVSA
jgi:hypothetical protein